MLNDYADAEHVYIACGYTDLRKGIDGLAKLVQTKLKLDPCSSFLFLFCGKRADRIKGLLFERDGFLLLYKRIEKGCFHWPRNTEEAMRLTPRQFQLLMEGFSIENNIKKFDKIEL